MGATDMSTSTSNTSTPSTQTTRIPRIEIERRAHVGSRYSQRLRKAGRLPVVIYGHKQEALHASVDHKQMMALLHTRAHLLEAVLDQQPQAVLVKDIQWDHLGSDVLHVDLARVDLNERVRVRVEVVFLGEAPGLKEEGAILEHPITEIEVECLATQIPEKVKLDVSMLKLGETRTAKDLELPAGVTCALLPETVLASITLIKEEVVEVAPAEAVAAEPELIGKKAEEGEEGAAAEGAEGKAGAPAGKAGEKKSEGKAEKK
jgi:large subunit ribosomal protein L25